MFGKFLTTPLGSALRVALGVVLGYVVLDLKQDGTVSITLDELYTYVAAGIAVGTPILIAALNKADTRFGRTE